MREEKQWLIAVGSVLAIALLLCCWFWLAKVVLEAIDDSPRGQRIEKRVNTK
ncbi:MAG: hypothetical protein ABI539_01230 [Acidobacteriota bacterium]